MPRLPPSFRIRQIERFRIARSEHGFAIIESRIRWWIAFLAVIIVTLALTWAMVEYYGNIDDVAWFAVGVAGIPIAAIAFLCLTYHIRVVVDRRDGVIRAQRRFLFLPIWTHTLPLRGAYLVGSPMPIKHTFDTREGEVDGIGCLLLLAGPIGLLIGAFRNVGRHETRLRAAPGVYHIDADGHPTPLFAMKLGFPLRLDVLHRSDPELVDHEYHNSRHLADRVLASRESRKSDDT